MYILCIKYAFYFIANKTITMYLKLEMKILSIKSFFIFIYLVKWEEFL